MLLKKMVLATVSMIIGCSAYGNIGYPEASCGEYFAQIDSLYWTACARGLMYGSETRHSEIVASNTFSDFDIKIKNPHHKWDVGYRLGLGYRPHCECFDVAVYWINFENTAAGHFDVPCIDGGHWFTPAWGIISPLLGGNTVNGENPLNCASAHWKLRLNLIDVVIGRPFCVNSCLSLRPYIGARGAIFDQRYLLDYRASLNGSIEDTPGVQEKFKLKTKFEGAGLRLGMETQYDIGCGFAIYGDLAGSLLWGREKISTYSTRRSPPSDQEFHLADFLLAEEECGCLAITDAAIGIRWSQCCFNKIFTLELGWEHHFFFNTSKFEKTVFNGSNPIGFPVVNRYPQDIHDDLSIQGLVSNLRVYF